MDKVEHLDWNDLFTFTEEEFPGVTKYLDEYFQVFSNLNWTVNEDGTKLLSEKQPCVNCGENITPNMIDSLISNCGFTWGLVHGEGSCRNCGWPARAYHFLEYDGKDLGKLTLILQYHPDYVEKRDNETR